ncbi:hypothetical protein [Oceanobacillus luteolus]|uniref:Uncharacterized protein n=1 Tax=Oceanobacillus luteolus TaxID=1274358 RepID=A0ABW4HP12_9BACI
MMIKKLKIIMIFDITPNLLLARKPNKAPRGLIIKTSNQKLYPSCNIKLGNHNAIPTRRQMTDNQNHYLFDVFFIEVLPVPYYPVYPAILLIFFVGRVS